MTTHYVATSPLAQALSVKAQRLARSGCPVLLLGESGTGKTTLARRIHNYSGVDGPFVDRSAAHVPKDLVLSELFGHIRGAFTGAEQAREGWLKRADGGTLFIDEVAELPLPAQTALLTALDSGRAVPVGGSKPVHSQFRLITATSRNLPELVARGAFRWELYWRIAGAVLEVPPLRARLDDLPELVEFFAGEEGAELEAGALEVLRAHAWPGNLRELRGVIRTAAALTPEGVTRCVTLREALEQHAPMVAAMATARVTLSSSDETPAAHPPVTLNTPDVFTDVTSANDDTHTPDDTSLEERRAFVTLHQHFPSASARSLRITAWLITQDGGSAQRREISRAAGVSPDTASRMIYAARDEGLVTTTGKGNQTGWTLTDAARQVLDHASSPGDLCAFDGCIPSMKVRSERPGRATSEAWPDISTTRQHLARQFPQLPQGARDAVAFITTQPGLRARRRDVDAAMRWSNPTSRRWLGEARDLGLLEIEGTGGDTRWCLTALAREALRASPPIHLDPANEDNPNNYHARSVASPSEPSPVKGGGHGTPPHGLGLWRLGLGSNVAQRSARFATQHVRSAGLRLAAASHAALLWLAQEPDAGD